MRLVFTWRTILPNFIPIRFQRRSLRLFIWRRLSSTRRRSASSTRWVP